MSTKHDWKLTLRNYIANKTPEMNKSSEIKEIEDFQILLKEWKDHDKNKEPNYKIIPKFYQKLPSSEDILLQKLREEARAMFLQRKSKDLLDNDELQALWAVLEKFNSPPINKSEQFLNYEDFKFASSKVSEKCRQFFLPSIFAKLLGSDPHGRISSIQFFNYIMRKVWLHQTRIGLSLYDLAGLGYLKEIDLDNYILELIPTLPQLEKLEQSFYNFYICTAVRKFFFFLDPCRTQKIRIQDILACGFLDDLLELREDDLPKEIQESNWFSAPSALRVYSNYLMLDTDHNGMLSRQELSKYGSGSLSPVFLDRIFQECLTYEGEMDYKTYLDFVLAMENPRETASIQYIFRILDLEHKGYLTSFDLNYFYRVIQENLKEISSDRIQFEDVNNEIFDMVKPEDPCKITLRDIIKSNQGDTILGILTDYNLFWMYENRENTIPDANSPVPSK